MYISQYELSENVISLAEVTVKDYGESTKLYDGV